ncbi:MAG: hypothetical protein C0478_13355 [Planctomyces sp.]|nr:hypothetical protein [Planctomyces sp.]
MFQELSIGDMLALLWGTPFEKYPSLALAGVKLLTGADWFDQLGLNRCTPVETCPPAPNRSSWPQSATEERPPDGFCIPHPPV